MASKVYVGNIPYQCSEAEISSLFGDFNVKNVRMIYDRETNQFKGFAFVELSTPEDVKNAIDNLDQCVFGGRVLKVAEARERVPGSNGNGTRPPRVEHTESDRGTQGHWAEEASDFGRKRRKAW